MAHVAGQQANAGAATNHFQHQFIGMQLHHPGQALVHQIVPRAKTVDLPIMLPLHEQEIGQVIKAVRARSDPGVTFGNMRQVVETRQAPGFADGKTRPRQR